MGDWWQRASHCSPFTVHFVQFHFVWMCSSNKINAFLIYIWPDNSHFLFCYSIWSFLLFFHFPDSTHRIKIIFDDISEFLEDTRGSMVRCHHLNSSYLFCFIARIGSFPHPSYSNQRNSIKMKILILLLLCFSVTRARREMNDENLEWILEMRNPAIQ